MLTTAVMADRRGEAGVGRCATIDPEVLVRHLELLAQLSVFGLQLLNPIGFVSELVMYGVYV